jgi:hypothetical protein
MMALERVAVDRCDAGRLLNSTLCDHAMVLRPYTPLVCRVEATRCHLICSYIAAAACIQKPRCSGPERCRLGYFSTGSNLDYR